MTGGIGLQLILPGAEIARLTRQQYAYARVRGVMPPSRQWPDWKCRLLADGMSESEIEAVDDATKAAAQVAACRWNKLPGVKIEIERERAIALGALKMTAEAWWAKVQRLEAMAAGDLPQVRTVVVQRDEVRELITEEIHETHFPTMAKAVEMQGRALAVFVDRSELSGKDGGAIRIEDDAENRARIEELLRQAGMGSPSDRGEDA